MPSKHKRHRSHKDAALSPTSPPSDPRSDRSPAGSTSPEALSAPSEADCLPTAAPDAPPPKEAGQVTTDSKQADAPQPTGDDPSQAALVQTPTPTLLTAAAKLKAPKATGSQVPPGLSPPSSASPPGTEVQAPVPAGAERTSASPGEGTSDEAPVAAAAPVQAPVFVPHEPHFRQAQPGSGAGPFIACFLVLVLLAIFGLLAVKATLPLWLSRDQSLRSVFCCSDEVQALAGYLNTTVNPCDSFFDFVCSRIVRQRREQVGTAASSLFLSPPSLNLSFDHNAVTRSHGSKSTVSAFLRSLFDSCMSAAMEEDTARSKLATSLVLLTGDYLRDMNLVNAFTYLLLTNLKYRIPSIVSINWKKIGAITIAHNARGLDSLTDSNFQNSAIASTTMLNQLTNRRTTVEDVIALANMLGSAYPKEVVVEPYAGTNATELLQRWRVKEALETTSIPLGVVNHVDVSGRLQIEALVRAVESSTATTTDAAAAYLLASSLRNAIEELHWPSTGSKAERLSFCMGHVNSMPNVRNIMYHEEFATQDKSIQVLRVINSIIEAVTEDCVSSPAFRPEDIVHLKNFLEGLSLSSKTSSPDIKNINFTQDFLQKLLDGHAYELETSLSLASAGLPFDLPATGVDHHYIQLHNREKIVVSPALYALTRRDSGHSDIFNTPIIPLALAEAIWAFILKDNSFWSDTSRTRINDLVACFREKYLTTDANETRSTSDVDTVAAALALSSVMKSFREQRWYKVEEAWRYWSLSHAQFFYMREAFYRCTASHTQASRDHVNVPLMYVGDFSRAFQCQGAERMTRTQVCALNRKHSVAGSDTT